MYPAAIMEDAMHPNVNNPNIAADNTSSFSFPIYPISFTPL
ncbi:MAG: hypothetical protein NT098_05560 [Candidatus Parcubacteria bacterium]|nr:hypothetical protein [Candidatus Parcubacteria bacterium]